MAARHTMTKHIKSYTASPVGPTFAKQLAFRITYACTSKLTLRPCYAPVGYPSILDLLSRKIPSCLIA